MSFFLQTRQIKRYIWVYIWKLTGYEAEKLSVLRIFFRVTNFVNFRAGVEKSLAPILSNNEAESTKIELWLAKESGAYKKPLCYIISSFYVICLALQDGIFPGKTCKSVIPDEVPAVNEDNDGSIF